MDRPIFNGNIAVDPRCIEGTADFDAALDGAGGFRDIGRQEGQDIETGVVEADVEVHGFTCLAAFQGTDRNGPAGADLIGIAAAAGLLDRNHAVADVEQGIGAAKGNTIGRAAA